MGTLAKVRIVWSGAPVVGGGVSTLYTLGSGSTLANALHALTSTLINFTPLGTVMLVDNAGDTIDEATGEINGVWTGATTSQRTSTVTGVYAAGVGMRIVWDTAGVTHGRRVRGSTYVVPLAGAYYSSDGTIDNTMVTGSLQTALNTFRTAVGSDFCVYTRRSGTTSGVAHSVTAAAGADKVSWLRSRRI